MSYLLFRHPAALCARSIEQLDHHSDMCEAALSWVEEVEGSSTPAELMVLTDSIDRHIDAGRSVVLHGHPSMVGYALP